MEPENVKPEQQSTREPGMGMQVATGACLTPGTSLGNGRYCIGDRIRECRFGQVYLATDRGSGHTVDVLVVLAEAIADSTVFDRLRAEAATASRLDHKNIARVLDIDTDSNRFFVVTEHIDGHSLRSLVENKRAAGLPAFSLKGAYNVVAHICNALALAHRTTIHGALSAGNVLVNRAGRVKLTEFGLARAIPGCLVKYKHVGDQAAIAPEILLAPRDADWRADIYSTGVILHELLTGQIPMGENVRPSGVVPELPEDLDRVVARCLAKDPGARFPDVLRLKSALQAAIDSRAGIGRPASIPPGNVPGTSPPAAMPAASATPSVPAKPAALATPPTPVLPPTPAVRPPSHQLKVSIETLESFLAPRPGSSAGETGVDEYEEKWLVRKGKLDFGPFSLAQIKEQISRDEVVEGDLLVDKDNGERRPVEESPSLRRLVKDASDRRDRLRRANAEVKAAKQDSRRGLALYLIIGAGVACILGGAYFLVRALSHAERKNEAGPIAALDKAELNVTIALRPPEKGQSSKRSTTRKTGGERKPGSSNGSSPGFDDTVDYGNIAESGRDEWEQLSSSQLNPVIQAHGASLGKCLLQAQEKRAEIEFIVKGGDGKVSQVRVNGETATSLAGCIRERMQRMEFPTFRGLQTKASFEMSI
ncbi:MAG: protein kinase [Pseudomonadota bacterium]